MAVPARFTLESVLCALVLAALTGTAAARGGSATPTPSAKELWNTYPLQRETPAPAARGRQATLTTNPRPYLRWPSPESRGPARSAGDAGGGTTGELPIIVLVAAAGAAALIAARRRLQLPVASPALRFAGPAPDRTHVAPPRAAAPPAARALTAKSSPDAGAPPEPHRPWTAEVVWDEAGDSACFRVRAEPIGGGVGVIVASSPGVAWPPSADSVRELDHAVEVLTASMIAAGWKPLPDGDAWYARRFTWPLAAPAPAGRPWSRSRP